MQNIGGVVHVKLDDGTLVPVVAIVGTGGEIEVTGPNVQKMIPAPNGYAITPNNSTDLPNNIRAIYVGSAGDIKVDFVDSGSGVVIKNATAGSILPFQVKRVYATGTTATNLVGLF
jgi:hypothetical protein